MAAINDETIIDSLRAGVLIFLRQTGRNADAAANDLEAFLNEIKPDVYTLLLEPLAGRPITSDSLQLFADSTAARAARLGLQFADAERSAIVALIAGSVRAAAGVLSVVM